MSPSRSGGKAGRRLTDSFVVCPHPYDLHNVAVFEHLINETMLDIDPPGICSSQITDEFFVPWRSLERVLFEDRKQFLRFRFQSRSRKFFGIFSSLFGVNKRPLHQSSSGEHFSTGVFSPRMIDSRIFGMESKYNVS